MLNNSGYMSAKEAAAELNVSVATLYAYVSRGIIQSEARPGTRVRRYRTADIRALAEKSKVSGKHSDAANILTFGIPILDSEITYTDGRYLYFRGRDSSLLATTSTNLESVAALIWDCDDRQVFTEPVPVVPVEESLFRSALGVGHPLILCQAMLPMIGEKDWRAYDFSKNGACRTGTCILRLVTSLITNTVPSATAVHETLALAWNVVGHAPLVRSALILAADHELNASTFTVRVAASARASLYDAVAAGLATLQGSRHGGEIERTYRFLQELILESVDPGQIVAAWMRRGETIPGFGHPLYQEGDPRAVTLLELMSREISSLQSTAVNKAILVAQSLTGKKLNFDGALAALTLNLGLPIFSGICLLAIGRVVGWIGHAIEQYNDNRLIRPRARYIGLR